MARNGERVFLGFDFGTESVRAVCVAPDGRTLGTATHAYEHGQIVRGSPGARQLFAEALPPDFALQHPLDWIASCASACKGAIADAGVDPAAVAGIGADFTSCTMLPSLADGTPLCLRSASGERSDLADDPHAWPKLWKHHGAMEQTERLNRIAEERTESWLARYGGTIGLEWLFPKMLEVIERSPKCADRAEVWLEAGDWFVWQLVGAPFSGGDVRADALPRSTCQAGYKGLWEPEAGYPSRAFCEAVSPDLAKARDEKLPGRFVAPGQAAGGLCPALAERFGLPAGVPVSAAIIDAHAGVPGAGVGRAGTLVLVMGTSGCHMAMGEHELLIPGVAGVVKDGILPGYFGYETGQAAMGDAFDLVRRLAGRSDFAALDEQALDVAPGAEGLLVIDWFNGCRTPLMDGALTGAVLGLRLDHTPAQLYRATLESVAFGLRWIVDTMREGGLAIDEFVATGGLPTHNPLFTRLTASVLERPIHVHQSANGPARGAAIIGALAAGAEAGGYDDPGEAVSSMAGDRSAIPAPRVTEPEKAWAKPYRERYALYREACEQLAAAGSLPRRLRHTGT